jgi:hypothetical protein
MASLEYRADRAEHLREMRGKLYLRTAACRTWN